MLGRRVGAEHFIGFMARYTACINDLSFCFLLNKLSGGSLSAKNDAIHIDSEQFVQLFLCNLQKRRHGFDTRIVNKNIQTSKLINRCLDQIKLLFPYRYIPLNSGYLIILAFEFRNRVVQQRFIYVMQHNAEPVFAQPLCNAFS
ncbi:hypothetical protein D3C73_1146610 [compost metagenome]